MLLLHSDWPFGMQTLPRGVPVGVPAAGLLICLPAIKPGRQWAMTQPLGSCRASEGDTEGVPGFSVPPGHSQQLQPLGKEGSRWKISFSHSNRYINFSLRKSCVSSIF